MMLLSLQIVLLYPFSISISGYVTNFLLNAIHLKVFQLLMMQLIMSNNQVVKLVYEVVMLVRIWPIMLIFNNKDNCKCTRVTSEPTLTPTPMLQLLHHQRALHQSRMDHQGVYFDILQIIHKYEILVQILNFYVVNNTSDNYDHTEMDIAKCKNSYDQQIHLYWIACQFHIRFQFV